MSLVSVYNCNEAGCLTIPEMCPECGFKLGKPLSSEGNFWYKDPEFHVQYFAAQYCCPECWVVLAHADDFRDEQEHFLAAFHGKASGKWSAWLYESQEEADGAIRDHKRASCEALNAYRLPAELAAALDSSPKAEEQFLDLLDSVLADVSSGNFSELDPSPLTETQKGSLAMVENFFASEDG